MNRPYTVLTRKILGIFAVGLIAAMWQSMSFAQLSMNEVVQRSLDSHPQLKVAKSDIAIAQARLIDAGKLANPFLEFGLTSQIKDGPDREGTMFVGYSQIFPVTDKLLRQRNVGKADVQVACAEVLEVERNFIAQVQEAYIRALGAHALVSEMKQIENSAQKSIDLAKEQKAMALGSELDIAAAETEKVLAGQDRVLAEGVFRQAIATLKPLMGMQPNETIILSNSLPEVINELRKTVHKEVSQHQPRADIVAAEVRKKRAQAEQELAHSEILEDWELNAGYEAQRTVDEPVGVDRERLISLGVRIPLPVRQDGRGRIAEAQAKSEKAEHEIAVAKVNQQAEITAARADLSAAEATAESLQEQVLPQLQSREKKIWQAYQQGLADINQIILLQQQQARTQRAITRMRQEEALALARLQHALGTHPALKVYNPCECPSYLPETVSTPKPWALPVLSETKAPVAIAKSAQVVPRSNGEKNKPFQKLFRKLRNK